MSLKHLENLPGLISVQILFDREFPNSVLEEPINVNLPICSLIPLTPEEQLKLEKKIIIKREKEKEETKQKIEDNFKKCKEYEKFIKNDLLLEVKTLE